MSAGSETAPDCAGHSGAQVGDIRAEDAREYGYQSGFVVEQFGYWNRELCWAVPAWEERGEADLSGIFSTRDEAMAAIRKAMQP